MTTFNRLEVCCAICGVVSKQTKIASVYGRPCDLDWRPGEMERSAIRFKLQLCPNCGYCARDISKAADGVREVIDRKDYSIQMRSEDFPALANRFLCAAMIVSHVGLQLGTTAQARRRAFWTTLEAAWICDDVRRASAAQTCRLQAAEMLERLIDDGESLGGHSELHFLVLVDVLRRARDFGRARARCQAGLEMGYENDGEQILRFHLSLINVEDSQAHRFDEIPGCD